MAFEVSSTNYSTARIYEQVKDQNPAPNSNVNFASLFTDASCTLKLDFKAAPHNSLYFSGYVGKSRNILRDSARTYGEWSHNQFCTEYSGCTIAQDSSWGIICGGTEILYDCYFQYIPSWITIYAHAEEVPYEVLDDIRQGFIIDTAPNSVNSSPSSRTDYVVVCNSIGNIYQVTTPSLGFECLQWEAPTAPVLNVDTDPSDYGNISFSYDSASITAGSANANVYGLLVSDPSNFYGGGVIDVSWRGERTLPTALNYGYGSRSMEEDVSSNETFVFDANAQSGDTFYLYLKVDPVVNYTPFSKNFTRTGGDVSINITTSIKNPWIATDSCAWITLSNESGTGDGQFIITVMQQPSEGVARSGRVYINSQAPQQYVSITQDSSLSPIPPDVVINSIDTIESVESGGGPMTVGFNYTNSGSAGIVRTYWKIEGGLGTYDSGYEDINYIQGSYTDQLTGILYPTDADTYTLVISFDEDFIESWYESNTFEVES